MASLARQSPLRQIQLLSSSSKRFLSTSSSPLSVLRPTTSILHRPAQTPSRLPRFAPFSTTSQQRILPPGPQVIQGGVNDPAPVPKPSPIHGSYHWDFERLLSIGLVPLTLAPFAGGTAVSPAVDAALVFAVVLHSHIGFQACVTDYFSTLKHPKLRKFFDWVLNIATILVAVAFYEFETNDVGVTEAIKRIWRAGANDVTAGKASLSQLGHDGKLKHLKE